MHSFCSSASVAELHGVGDVVGGVNDETIVFQASGADEVRQLCFKAEQLLVWVTLLLKQAQKLVQVDALEILCKTL